MAQEKSFGDVQVRSSEIGIRTIGLNDLWQSLKEGYDDFNAMPAVGVFLTVLFYLLFALLLTLFLVGGNLLHLAFPMVAGLTLIGPVVSVGLFEMSRRRERGLDRRRGSTFDFVHSASFAPILAISVVAFPLLLDRPASAATAVATSFRAVASNLMVMVVWGLIVVVLLAAGAIVFLLGLAAVLPILGHATWHLYRKVVEP